MVNVLLPKSAYVELARCSTNVCRAGAAGHQLMVVHGMEYQDSCSDQKVLMRLTAGVMLLSKACSGQIQFSRDSTVSAAHADLNATTCLMDIAYDVHHQMWKLLYGKVPTPQVKCLWLH